MQDDWQLQVTDGDQRNEEVGPWQLQVTDVDQRNEGIPATRIARLQVPLPDDDDDEL